MTAEDNFIKKLGVYLDTEFNSYDLKKINTLLKEYRNEIPPVLLLEREANPEKFIPKLPILPQGISDEQLLILASEICLIHKVSINEFMQTKKGYCPRHIVQLRKEFCRNIKETYIIQNKQLKDFFGVNHTTISFYIYDKPYTRRKKLTA